LKFVLAQLEDQKMKRGLFSEEQIIAILKEHEAGLLNRPGFAGGSNS